jgi:hypothetical protein
MGNLMDAKDCDAVLHVGQDYELTLISAAEQLSGWRSRNGRAPTLHPRKIGSHEP